MGRERYTIRPPAPNILTDGLFGRDRLDRAHEAVKRVDQAEGVILRMHQRYLLDPAEKIVASQEIVDTIDRAVRTSAIMKRVGVARTESIGAERSLLR
jgi:hypothetical protein